MSARAHNKNAVFIQSKQFAGRTPENCQFVFKEKSAGLSNCILLLIRAWVFCSKRDVMIQPKTSMQLI